MGARRKRGMFETVSGSSIPLSRPMLARLRRKLASDGAPSPARGEGSQKTREQHMIPVGVILGAHGIRGEVKVKSFTTDPKAFSSYGPLTASDGRIFEIVKSKPAADHFICTLRSVTDRNQAEALKGIELSVAREKLPPLQEGEFYLSDLWDKNLVADGKSLGSVVGFQNYGAGDLMELQSGELIPVAFIRSVSDKVLVDLPGGYLDEAEAP
jgi:16S rRNA processing protein RimM